MSMYMYLDNGILVTSIGVNIVYIQMLISVYILY